MFGEFLGCFETPCFGFVQRYIETMVGGDFEHTVAQHSEFVDFAGLMCEADDFFWGLIYEAAALLVVDSHMMSVVDVRYLYPALVCQHIVVGGQAEFITQFW